MKPIILFFSALVIFSFALLSCQSSPTNATKESTTFSREENKNLGTTIGKILPDFSQKDPSGVTISLSDFRGTYLLVDFWASWCAPCRKENKNLVNTFHKFKDKNFTILSVSLDKDKSQWTKAIKEDKLEWNHVSDLQFWDNQVARKFEINSIPDNFFLTPQGVIIGKNLFGDDLDITLLKHLNN